MKIGLEVRKTFGVDVLILVDVDQSRQTLECYVIYEDQNIVEDASGAVGALQRPRFGACFQLFDAERYPPSLAGYFVRVCHDHI